MNDAKEPTLQSFRDRGVTQVQLGLTESTVCCGNSSASTNSRACSMTRAAIASWMGRADVFTTMRFTGWHTGFPTVPVDRDTLRWLPDTPRRSFW